jgi:GTP cyclohydrolase IA
MNMMRSSTNADFKTMETNREVDIKRMSMAVKEILSLLGENPLRSGLKDTPERVALSLLELTSGQGFSALDLLNDAIFPCPSSGMVLQKGLEFYSLCEHHLLPFFGRIHLAYLPDKNIIGLSKLGRIIDIFAKRLQVQETLTHQIAHALNNIVKPHGVAVIIEASHLCMMMRGVKKQGSLTITREYIGRFNDDPIVRSEFISAVK